MVKGKKRKSLRSLVFTWFFFFTLVPLVILAFVVQDQYQKGINQQIKDRLTVHVRELESLFAKKRTNLEDFITKALQDKSLIYFISTVDPEGFKAVLSDKIQLFDQEEVKVYSQGGQVFVYFNEKYKSVHGMADLPSELRERLEDETSLHRVLFQKDKKGKNVLALSIVRKIVGLSISYGIVKSHGGQIQVESQVGEGTTFHIDLPIYRE